MKTKFYLLGLAMLLSLSTITVKAGPVESKAAIKARITAMTADQKEARAAFIKLRVEEIRSMDKSALSSMERKELRQELRTMKYEANSLGSGGIYLSLAGIIIIVLLLVLLL